MGTVPSSLGKILALEHLWARKYIYVMDAIQIIECCQHT